MSYLSNRDIERIARGLEARTLARSDWTHAAHFAAAFWFLRRQNVDVTIYLPDLIRSYNESTGNPNTDVSGYHETITQASIRAARAWLAAHPAAPLDRTLAEFLAGPQGHPGWMSTYWSRDRLFTPTARRSFISPDLQPLPF